MPRLLAALSSCLLVLSTPTMAAAADISLPYGLSQHSLLTGLFILLSVALVLRISQRMRREIARSALLQEELRSSESHYRSLVENLSAITWEATPDDFTYTYVSAHAETLLGYPLNDWKQPGFWQRCVHPADFKQAMAYCREETAAGRSHSLEYRMQAADGRLIWVRDIITLTPLEGRLTMRGLMIDISEAKQTEQALRLSEQKFSSVFQQCPDILVIARQADGCLLEVNRAFEQQTGISAREAIGRTATQLNIWDSPSIGAMLIERLQQQNLRNFELLLRRHNGELFTGLISAQAFQHADTPALVVVIHDISQLKATQRQLKISEEKFAKAFHASPDGLLITRAADGRVLESNHGFGRITGYSIAQIRHRTTLELGIWAEPSDRQRMLEQLRLHGSVHGFTVPIRTQAGTLRLCELSAQTIPIEGEACILTIARDVTERQLLQEKLQQAATVFESTAEGVMITDTEYRIVAINRAFSAITGYSEAQALGQTPDLLTSEKHDNAFYDAIRQQLDSQGHWQGELWSRRYQGELYPKWMTINAVRNQAQQTTHFVGVFADISSLKHAQARLDHQAHHDPLTGLPNRLLFEDRLHQALGDHMAHSQPGAVLFLDLDRFKHINDSLGHPVGDQLLKRIALRLKDQLRDHDTMARLGGDEFIILLPNLQQREDATQIAQQLLECFTQPFQLDEHEFFISVSIGVSTYPEDGMDVATLVKNADAAMYRSKAKGRNRVEHYTRDLTFQATERMSLEQELRRALEREELELFYQPKVSLTNQRLVGAEALLRWQHPVFGEVPPDRFIPLAEDSGLILPLGDWVLQRACQQMRHWQQHYAPFGPLSVNLAGVQLRQPQLLERIAQLLELNTLAPHLLQLEITESFIMNKEEEGLALLHQLKALGVQLAIDDFGTGYSSLSHLKRLPLDTLKIDQSFVRGLPNDTNDAAITRAIIALGRSLQLTVIAEGVETKAQEFFLAAEGCEHIQGFVLSRPVSAEAFAANFLQPRHTIGAAASTPV